MLIIPMWLELEYRRDGWTPRTKINFCYSPDPNIWWWHDMKNGTSGYEWDLNRNIVCCEDLQSVEEKLLDTHPEVDNPDGFSWLYRFCVIDSYRMTMAADIFYPNPTRKLPWTLPIEKQIRKPRLHYEWNADTYYRNGTSFLLDYDVHTNWHAAGELFTMKGIIRKGNSMDLLWRHVYIRRVGFTDDTYNESIWGINVVEWMFCGSDNTRINRDYPNTTQFRRTWFESEKLTPGYFPGDVVRNTAVSMFLYPEPPTSDHP